jgi:hypothetical protein
MPFHWPEFDNDDPRFMRCATELIGGMVAGMGIPRYQTFRIDNWFGPNWLGFCGKMLGAFGVAKSRNIVIPPFVQNRLTAQSLFVRQPDGGYTYEGDGPKVHHIGKSESNFKNYAHEAAPDTTLVWISGNSRLNQRGSIMAYKPGPENYMMFYVEYQNKNDEWTISQHKNMPPGIADFLRAQSVRYQETLVGLA